MERLVKRSAGGSDVLILFEGVVNGSTVALFLTFR